MIHRKRRKIAFLLPVVIAAGMFATLVSPSAQAATAQPGKDVRSAAVRNLQRPAAAPSCDQIKADPTGKGVEVCKVDSAKLPAKVRAAARQADAAPLAVECEQDKLNTNRTESCIDTPQGYYIFDVETGEILGTADFEVVLTAALDVRSRTWTQRAEVTLLDVTGLGESGFEALATAFFPDNASGFSATESDPQSVVTIGTPVEFAYTVTSPGPATVKGHVEPDLIVAPDIITTSPAIQYEITPAPSVRCDSTANVGPRTGGCVYDEYVPTYDVSTTTTATSQVAWHILWAQHNLQNHWGWLGHGPALTRTQDPNLISANRRAACPSRRRRPPGMSCDEYPFATTYEGALSNPDFSWHWVPAWQNTAEGRDYRAPWYTANRLLDGDPFWVNVVLPAGFTASSPIPGFAR